MWEATIKIILICIAIPTMTFYCVKYGTVGFYKAKQFIKREEQKRKEP